MRFARSLTALGLFALGLLTLAPSEASAFGHHFGRCGWGGYGCCGYCPPPCCYMPICCYPVCYPGCYGGPGYYGRPGMPPAQPATPAKPTGMSTAGILEIDVPAEARVFVNGLATKSTGTHRRFVSPGLLPGMSYTYEVRVEIPGAQLPVVETKTVNLRAGQREQLAFAPAGAGSDAIAAPAQLPTSLTLHVPADAQVILAGNPTTTTGAVRVYSVLLPAGERLDSYSVRVEIQRGGKLVAREQTISLAAGDAREMSFDLNSPAAPALAASK